MSHPLHALALLSLLLAAGAGAARPADVDVALPLTADALFPCRENPTAAPRPDWAPHLTPRRPTAVERSTDAVPSTDGVTLSVKTYLPTDVEAPYPTILILSPYHGALGLYGKDVEPDVFDYADCATKLFLEHGYAVVLGDMRGTRNSDGCFDYGGPGDQDDAVAIVEWIASRGWSDGTVGMYGASHVGMSQYAAAVRAPDALKAIIPTAPISSFYRYLYSGGVHYETNMATPPAYEYAVAAPPPTDATSAHFAKNVLDTPCGAAHMAEGMSLDGTFDDFWKARDYPSMAGNIRAAVFHTHGTLDENVKMDHFTAIWDALEAHDVARKALVGPWRHEFPRIPWWNLTAVRFYEHHLKGIDTGMMDEPALTLVDQTGVARTAHAFPPEHGETLALHLSKGALAGTPVAGTATYRDNPALFRPALRAAESHRLLYTGAAVAAPLRVSGVPVVELVASIDRADTNVVVHLYDVAPDGAASYVTRGYLDARLRHGLDRPQDVPTGVPQTYRVELHAREYVVPEGHRLQVLVASSDRCPWFVSSPDLDRAACGNSGVVSDATLATVKVHEGHGLSRLLLPVAPR